MKRVHLLHVEAPASAFEPLISAAQEAGLRLGWLRLDATSKLPAPLPEELAEAAGAGVLRAVHSGAAGTVVVKPRRGAPVLRDLLREHFRGCAAVLVAGDLSVTVASVSEPAPVAGSLQPPVEPIKEVAQGGAESRWRILMAYGGERAYTTAELVAELRKPHPWG